MNHFGLKFNHGVEIGARLAYLGHYKRTGDDNILQIANDELHHKEELVRILKHYNEKPSKLIDGVFSAVGSVIYYMCKISPEFLLNLVARSFETFAVVSYANLAVRYSDFKQPLLEMAEKELEHELYFK